MGWGGDAHFRPLRQLVARGVRSGRENREPAPYSIDSRHLCDRTGFTFLDHVGYEPSRAAGGPVSESSVPAALPGWTHDGAHDVFPYGIHVGHPPAQRERLYFRGPWGSTVLRGGMEGVAPSLGFNLDYGHLHRSEERRVGKECR